MYTPWWMSLSPDLLPLKKVTILKNIPIAWIISLHLEECLYLKEYLYLKELLPTLKNVLSFISVGFDPCNGDSMSSRSFSSLSSSIWSRRSTLYLFGGNGILLSQPPQAHLEEQQRHYVFYWFFFHSNVRYIIKKDISFITLLFFLLYNGS